MIRRVLAIELRRNPMLLMLPLAGVLCGVILFSDNLRPVALWTGRTLDLQFTLQVLGPVVAGVAAWTAGRETRRGMRDLVATTALPPRRRMLAGWTATTVWAVVCYLVLAGPALVVTAVQVTWGPVILWPVVVALAGVPACAALGHLLGSRLPGRLVAPLTAVGLFACLAAGAAVGYRGVRLAWLTPIYPAVAGSDGVFWPVRADLTVVQLLFLAGILATTLSLTGPRPARRRALPVTAAGLALIVAAGVLVSTGRHDPRGVVIPAVHNAATDKTVPYQPVCSTTAFVVCLHPAYTDQLGTIATMAGRIAAPVLGLPGVPHRLAQALPDTPPSTVDGTVRLSMPTIHSLSPDLANWLASAIAQALVSGTPHSTPAQQAVAEYLVLTAGYTPAGQVFPHDNRATAAKLTRQWLATHLSDVRAGTLEVIP